MKKIILSLVTFACLILTGCSKDAEVSSFITESDKLATEIVQKVNSSPTATGIDEAQKILDGRKERLRVSYESLQNVRGYQVKSETMNQLADSVKKNITAVNSLKIDLMGKTMSDKTFSDKLDKLVDEYNALYKN